MALYSPVSTPSATRGNPSLYTYKYKPTGVDYFYDNKPVTREQYTGGTGKQYSDIENNNPVYNVTKPTADELNRVGASSYSNVPRFDPTGVMTATDPGSGSSGSGPAIPQFNTFYNGRQYTNEDEYKQAVLQDNLNTYNSNKKTLEQAYQNGLISFDEKEAAIKQNKSNILKQREDLGFNYTNSKKAIGDTQKGALENQAGFFASVSPDAYQSGQQTLADKTNAQASDALTALDRTNSSNQEAIDQSLGQIDTQLAGLGRDRGEFQTGYENNLGGLEQSRLQGSDAVNNQILDFKNTVANAAAARAAAVAPKTTQYDPTDVLKALAGQYIGNQEYGMSEEQNRANIKNTYEKTGLNNPALLEYLYSNFIPDYQKTQLGL